MDYLKKLHIELLSIMDSKDEVVQGYKNKLQEVYLKRRLLYGLPCASDTMKFLKNKKSKAVGFRKVEYGEQIDLI